MFNVFTRLHEVTPLNPARLAWTDEGLLRCCSDDSPQNSHISVGAAPSSSDVVVDNVLASLFVVTLQHQRRRGQSRHIAYVVFFARVPFFRPSLSGTLSVTSSATLVTKICVSVSVVFSLQFSPDLMTSGMWTASGGLTPHLQHVSAGVKEDQRGLVAEHMEDVIVPTLAAKCGPRWMLIMDNAHTRKVDKALEWFKTALHEPSREQISCQHKQSMHTHTRTPPNTAPVHSAGIGHIIFQPACSPGSKPLDTWARNVVKRVMFAVRGRIELMAKAARAWAAVRSCPGRLLCDCANRRVLCIAAKSGAFRTPKTRDSRHSKNYKKKGPNACWPRV